MSHRSYIGGSTEEDGLSLVRSKPLSNGNRGNPSCQWIGAKVALGAATPLNQGNFEVISEQPLSRTWTYRVHLIHLRSISMQLRGPRSATDIYTRNGSTVTHHASRDIDYGADRIT